MDIAAGLFWLTDVSPFSWTNIGTAVLCGIIVGLERQLRGKPVGIRTASLIPLGTYLFLTSAFYLQDETGQSSRIIGQVITGVGFLGAGVTLVKDGAVVGVTSAATIWMLAAIGIMIGTGHAAAAVKLALLTVVILYGVDLVEAKTKSLTKGVHARLRKTLPEKPWRKQ
ncbi:MgtC/SapB family protein [Parendozoicomonas haliclonae]|uniref:Protein MgtC n=1 Tax=Parendozoicomonas haliclonae TaxID=1960125 RepID=A0A1X7AJR0_9GAMM|nr:MgtC/SapB family protein [Parendozoicomonas haliclonae]SMA47049.1 putative Mg(2+) transport ATPase [Parendozoicomonas haliclonae]